MLPVVLLLFITVAIYFVVQKKDLSNRAAIVLALLLSLALWSKLTTPLILPPLLACIALIVTKDFKKSLIFTVKVGALGLLVFLVTYFLYCIVLGLSPTYTYTFLLESFTKGTSSEGPIAGALSNLTSFPYFVYWPTIPTVGLIGVAAFGVLFDKDKDDRTRVKKLLVVTALLVTFFYIALIAPFGGFFKYPYPVFGLLLLAVAFYYDRFFKKGAFNIFYLAAAMLFGYLVEKAVWEDSMFLSLKPFEYLPLLLLGIVIAYFAARRYQKRTFTATAVLVFIFMCIGFQLSISRAQAVADYPTKYLYGQIGLDETTSYLRAQVKHYEPIWAMKDVGYYTYNQYHESYNYYFSPKLQKRLIKMLEDGKVRYYVATTGIGQDNIDYYDDIKEILEEHAVKEKQFGNYVIYKARDTANAGQ